MAKNSIEFTKKQFLQQADRVGQLESGREPAPVEVSCQTPMEQDDSHALEM